MRHATAPLLVLAAVVAPTSGALRAEEFTIEFFTSSFLPQSVTAEVGDTVRFVWRRGVHTVTSGAGAEDPSAGEFFDVPLTEDDPEFELFIGAELAGGVRFFDRENPSQAGFIEVSRGEETFRVGVVDNVFIPEVRWIFAGDSIRWEHEPMEMLHTVTSGASSAPEDDPGALFDAESSDARPIFVYRFEAAGTYPYFCRPHEDLDMAGVIHVQRRFLRGDANDDGTVELTDAVASLGALFLGRDVIACDDALDANDDGRVDIGDAVFTLGFLFLGGDPIPRPFPVEGADRTEDSLTCI